MRASTINLQSNVRRSRALACTVPIWLLASASAATHGVDEGAAGGEPGLTPHNLLGAWSFDPLVVILLALTAGLYAAGLARLWRSASRGHGVGVWEASCFAGGWLALVVALVSPLHPLGSVLFSAHMTQHEALMLIAAPLLVLGRPLIPFLWALPVAWRVTLGRLANRTWFAGAWRFVSAPFAAWAIHGVALWVWHIPILFEATLRSDLVHTLQHLSFLLSALLFSWAIVHGPRGRTGYGAAVLYIFTTAVHSSALGALLTFSRTPWYPSYASTAPAWGLTPLEDQQLGGLIMWVPAGMIYLAAGLILFAGWTRVGRKSEV